MKILPKTLSSSTMIPPPYCFTYRSSGFLVGSTINSISLASPCISTRSPGLISSFYTSIETIFPALTVNLLTVPTFIIDILSLGCSPEKIFYAPRLGATYRSPAGRIDAGACVLSLRRTSTHSLGSGALVGSAVGGRQAENERTWPTSSERRYFVRAMFSNSVPKAGRGRAVRRDRWATICTA